MMKYYYLIFVALVLTAGCVSNNETAVVASGDYVSVDYTGTFDNGTVFDSSFGSGPLEFVAGTGQMIRGFDDAIIGMKVGEEKTVRIEPKDAYGEYNESLIIELPKDDVPKGVVEGDTLYSGFTTVLVLAVGNDTVTIDYNYPLAGKALIFTITMLDIKKSA